MMKLHEYPEIGEKLYSTVLPNGLEIRVIPKKDFSTCYARTILSTRCSTCRTAITR